jgi:excinuclease UvrABC nuclease subunit
MSLPVPPLSVCLDVPADVSGEVDLKALPPRAGVFVLEDAEGGTLALATTANVRRAVATRLQPLATVEGPTRKIDYRRLARTVRALSVGGAFEADWVYLQLARQRVPGAAALAMDRWQAWFAQCDPQAQFPQWTKTAHPARTSEGALAPFPDKHAAGRYLELLQDAFDLCRYHHILVQAPHGSACAYKEMGKCPAPCDGSVSMEHYRGQIRESIAFGATPIERYRRELEARLAASQVADDEQASRRCESLLERTAAATKPAFAHVGRLEEFRYAAVMPSEHMGWARLFVILGGWIAPVMDVPADGSPAACGEIHELLMDHARRPVEIRTDADEENLSLVCWHLFRPAKGKRRGRFLPLDETFTRVALQRAIRALGKGNEAEPEVAEQFTEDAGAR